MGFKEYQLLAEKLETICRIGTELFKFQSYIHYGSLLNFFQHKLV